MLSIRFFFSFLLIMILHIVLLFPLILSEKPKQEPRLSFRVAVQSIPQKQQTYLSTHKRAKKPSHSDQKLSKKKSPEGVFQAAKMKNKNFAPTYPKQAREENMQGTVRAEVSILSSGKIDSVKIIQSSGHELLDNSVINSLKKVLFQPANLDGTPVKSSQKISFRFELED